MSLAQRPIQPGRSFLDLPDDELMVLAQDGDPRAFEAMVDRHTPAAFSLAYRMCGQRGTAEDIVQDTFLSLWRTGARYDQTRGSARSWVLGNVRHRAIDRFRKDAARTGRDLSDDQAARRLPGAHDTERETCLRADATEVRGAVARLPSAQREVIELSYFHGFSHSQIADLLMLPAGTVKGRMRLGIARLRAALRDLVDV